MALEKTDDEADTHGDCQPADRDVVSALSEPFHLTFFYRSGVPNLQSYLTRVLNPEDKVLVEEASSCLATGARRAAYITLWLPTAESLRRKFFEAQTFDGQAGRIVGQIQQREA